MTGAPAIRKRWIVLALLMLVSVITFLDRLAIAVAGLRMQEELGISPERWGWVLGAFVLTYGLFEIPTGVLGDRSGQRSVLTRIVVWWSACTALTGCVTSFLPLLVVRFLFGIGEAGAYPNISGAIARWFPPGERARTQGFIWGASRAGGALAPLLVVPMMNHLGWRQGFWILGAAGLAWATVWFLWYRDDPQSMPGITQAELGEIGPGSGTLGHGHPSLPWRRLATSRQMWLIATMYASYAWGSWFYFSWLHVYLVKGRGFTEREMTYYAALPFVLGSLANVWGGFLSDALVRRFGLRTGRRLLGSASLAASALMLAGAGFVSGRTEAGLLLALSFGTMDLMLPTAWALCLDIAGKDAGAVTGTMNMAGQFGGFVCTVLFGYVVERSGSYHAPLFLIATMLSVSALIFSRIDPSRPLFASEPTEATPQDTNPVVAAG